MPRNWFDKWIPEAAIVGGGGGSPDTTPPTIAIISPTPGAAPGTPGGFPADLAVAQFTPIVLEITDLAPGLKYACIVVRYPGIADEMTVYRRGAFRGSFLGPSSIAAITNGFRLTVRPSTGWPLTVITAHPGDDIFFELDALDGAGNLAA